MECTFLAFADLHHYSGEFLDDKTQRWDKLVRRGVEQKAAFMVGLGDYVHEPAVNGDFARRMMASPIDLYCCLDLNSAAYQYVNPPFGGYAPQVLALCHGMAYTLNFSEPLSAMITLMGDSRITIRGLTGEFLFGLTDEDVESVDKGRLSYARRSVPFIRDYEVDLDTAVVPRSRD